MNTHSGIVNTYSEKIGKVFRLNQNRCSRSFRKGVHDESEWVFRMGRNTHHQPELHILMKRLLHIKTLLLGIALACSARGEIVVVVNASNPVDTFSRRELVDLYMGRTQHFPDGGLALRLDLPPDSPTRGDFYRGLVNKSVGEVNAYWAKLLFTGRASPPQVMGNSASVLKAIRENKNAVGYLDSNDVDPSVKVVARVE